MSRTYNEVRITPSILDRLLDDDPGERREMPTSRLKSLRQLKQSVKRDLEWLLNTRQVADFLSADLAELNQSLAAYGLPDFHMTGVKTQASQIRLRRAIETAISLFEPRLENVVVTIDPIEGVDRTIRFRINARLKVEPVPEPLVFDTTLHSGGQYIVREG